MKEKLRVLLVILALISAVLILLYATTIHLLPLSRLHHRTVARPVINFTELSNVNPFISQRDMLLFTELTQSANIEKRSKWQMYQVNKFCQKYNESQSDVLLEDEFWTIRHKLYRHLLFNDQKKFIFCSLPKAGCTNLRRLILVINGDIPEDTAKLNYISESRLRQPALKISFLSKNLTNHERLHKISTYFKFVMIRNPLERLVSSYRNKLEQPLKYTTAQMNISCLLLSGIFLRGVDIFEAYKRCILERYRPIELSKWIQQNRSYGIHVTFAEFVQWKIESDDYTMNEHFSSVLTNTFPCTVRYHFYGNFKNYSREVLLLIEKLNTSRKYFTDHKRHHSWDETQVFLNRYYSQLHKTLKYKLFHHMYKELDFYYHLYPEEQWSHVEFLGIEFPIYRLNMSNLYHNMIDLL